MYLCVGIYLILKLNMELEIRIRMRRANDTFDDEYLDECNEEGSYFKIFE